MPLRLTSEKGGLASPASLAAIVETTADLVSMRMLDFGGTSSMNRAGRTMLARGPHEPVPDLMAFRTGTSRAKPFTAGMVVSSERAVLNGRAVRRP